MKKPSLVRTMILAGSLLLHPGTLCFQSRGAAGEVDLSFDPGSGVNSFVNAVVLQPDGKVIVSGTFTTVKGLARPGLARLHADGSGDATFNPAPGLGDVIVAGITLQVDGKIIVCGKFKAPLARAYAARLNSDGSLDNSFTAATDHYQSYPYGDGIGFTSVVVQPDGKVVLGGHFTDYFIDFDGADQYPQRYLIVRLNTNGTTDATFAAARGDYYTDIKSVALQSDGKVLMGGVLGGGATAHPNAIARLNADGTLDGTFNPYVSVPPPLEARVSAIAVQPDGKLLIGGIFTKVNGTSRNGIARLHADGTLDTTFNPGTGADRAVYSIALQPDGKVLIGGDFNTINGTSRRGIARLNANGGLDSSFDPGSGVGLYASVSSAAVQADGKVLIAGSFRDINGKNHERIARLNSDGSLDSSFNPGSSISYRVASVALQPDGKVLIGGEFDRVHGTDRNGIARLNADGSLDSGFNPGTGASYFFSGTRIREGSDVRSVVVQSDARVLIGGRFAIVDGTNRNGIARLNANGSLDHSFIPDTEEDNTVSALALQPDGKVLIGGRFTTSNGMFYKQIIRLNTDGSRDSSFNPDSLITYSTTIHSLVVQSDGKVLMGGVYYSLVSDPENGDYYTYPYLLTRLKADGSRDTSFEPAVGEAGRVPAPIQVVAVQPDGKVLLGGQFTMVKGANRDRIARLNADGTLDTGFNPDPGVTGSSDSRTVRSIAVQPDGKVLIAGSFTAGDGTGRNHIARLNANGSLDSSFNPGTGPDAPVQSIVLQSDGNVLAGGDFITVNGVVRPHVARLFGNSPPSLDIALSNGLAILSWPSTGLNFQLHETTNLSLPDSWSPVAQPAVTNGGQISVTIPATPPRKFFRLESQ